MGTSEVEKVVAKQVDEWTNRVVNSRDEVATTMRRAQVALAEARIASLALAAVHPGHDYIGQQAKYDAEVRELIAELAGLFVEEPGATVTVEVAVVAEETFTAEKLIDLAAQKIAARWKDTGELLAVSFEELKLAWLKTLEKAIQKHMTEPGVGL